jgi:hypothetical protein
MSASSGKHPRWRRFAWHTGPPRWRRLVPGVKALQDRTVPSPRWGAVSGPCP